MSWETGLHITTKDILNRLDTYQDDIRGGEEDSKEFFNDVTKEKQNTVLENKQNKIHQSLAAECSPTHSRSP